MLFSCTASPPAERRQQTANNDELLRKEEAARSRLTGGGLKISIVQYCGADWRPPPLSCASYYLCVCVTTEDLCATLKENPKLEFYLVNILLC